MVGALTRNTTVWLTTGLACFQLLAAITCCCYWKDALGHKAKAARHATAPGFSAEVEVDTGCRCPASCGCKQSVYLWIPPAGPMIEQDSPGAWPGCVSNPLEIDCRDSGGPRADSVNGPLFLAVSTSQRCALLCKLQL